MTTENKREDQKKEAWIKNVMRIQGRTREEAEELYNRVYPVKTVEKWSCYLPSNCVGCEGDCVYRT